MRPFFSYLCYIKICALETDRFFSDIVFRCSTQISLKLWLNAIVSFMHNKVLLVIHNCLESVKSIICTNIWVYITSISFYYPDLINEISISVIISIALLWLLTSNYLIRYFLLFIGQIIIFWMFPRNQYPNLRSTEVWQWKEKSN